MSEKWTPPDVSSHAMGDWQLPQATAWRQAAIEADDDDDAEQRTAGMSAPTLAAWLQDTGRSTTLHLAVAVGGNEPPATWFGLSTRAETEEAAVKALKVETDDIGSLLNAWGWFSRVDAQAPTLPSPNALHLVDATGDADALLVPTGGWSSPTLPAVLEVLSETAQRVTLHVSITPAIADASLIHLAEQAARRAVSRDDRTSPWEPSALAERALSLHGRVTASIVQLTLDGLPAGSRALHTWVSRSLSYDLGGDLVFSDKSQPLRLHGSRTQRLLEIATLRTSLSPQPSADDLLAAVTGSNDVPF